MSPVEVFIFLLFAHFLGDFPLQGDYLAMNKGKSWYLMFAHAMIWAFMICVVLKLYALFALWKVAFLVIPHMLVDRWKCGICYADSRNALFLDQTVHFVQLLIVMVS